LAYFVQRVQSGLANTLSDASSNKRIPKERLSRNGTLLIDLATQGVTSSCAPKADYTSDGVFYYSRGEDNHGVN